MKVGTKNLKDTKNIPLTKKQFELILYLKLYKNDYGYMPTMQEMADHFKIKLPSIQSRLDTLQRRGAVKRYKNRTRGLVVMI